LLRFHCITQQFYIFDSDMWLSSAKGNVLLCFLWLRERATMMRL
jgi:hypothetical protein